MFRNMQNAEIIRKMTEEFDEVTLNWLVFILFLFYLKPTNLSLFSYTHAFYPLIWSNLAKKFRATSVKLHLSIFLMKKRDIFAKE